MREKKVEEETRVGEEVGKLDLSSVPSGNVRWCGCHGKQVGGFSKAGPLHGQVVQVLNKYPIREKNRCSSISLSTKVLSSTVHNS